MGYKPELDASPMIDPSFSSYYQSQIVVLRWMVKLVQVDINTEVSILDFFLDLPWEGHLESVLHVYSYLCVNHNKRLALDPSYPEINESQFLQCDWK